MKIQLHALVFISLLPICTVTYAADDALLVSGAVFPGGHVESLAGVMKVVNGVKDGISFTHNYESSAGGVVSNEPSLPPEKLFVGNSWRVECKTDHFTDKSWCQIIRYAAPPGSGDLLPAFYTDGSVVCVPGNDFPGKHALVRVDKNEPEQSVGDDACLTRTASEQVLEQLRSGTTLRTRLYAWPYESPQDFSFSTYGLALAFEMMRWMEKHIH